MKFVFHNVFLDTFRNARTNQVLIMPFLFFMLVLILLTAPVGGLNLFLVITLIALHCVFLAGWHNMFYESVKPKEPKELSEEEKALETLSLYQEFFPGVGKNFWNFFNGILFYLLMVSLVFFVAEATAHMFVGEIKSQALLTAKALNTYATKTEILELVNKIPHDDKVKIAIIGLFDLVFFGVFSFFTMFWMQFSVKEEKNPLYSMLMSIKAVWKDLLNTFFIFLVAATTPIMASVIKTSDNVKPFCFIYYFSRYFSI